MSDLLGVEELADYMGVPKATLYKWNSEGTSPPRYRIGRRILYRLDEVDDWIEAHREPAEPHVVPMRRVPGDH